MPALQSLSDFIQEHTETILQEWENFARDIMRRGDSEYQPEVLRDHAAGILRVIGIDLRQGQTAQQQRDKSRGLGPRNALLSEAERHGAARVAEGFSVNDTMAEYRALRASVLNLWGRQRPDLPAVVEELTRFNEAIDQALTESLWRFSADKERQLRLRDTLLSSSPDLSYVAGTDGKLIYANPALSSLCGRSPDQMSGQTFAELGMEGASALQQQMEQVVARKGSCRAELSHTLASGRQAIYEYLFVPVNDGGGQVEAVAGTARDVTERKQTEERIRHSASYDSLTGVPNRALFFDRLDLHLKRAGRSGLPLALLFIDLDGFKDVNDHYGHATGDALLRVVAQRIRACVREVDTVARLGGDEFTVLLADVRKLEHVGQLAQQVLEQLARPFRLEGHEIGVSGSVGITVFPQDGGNAGELMRNADQAMYAAKRAGRNRYSYFSANMRAPAARAD